MVRRVLCSLIHQCGFQETMGQRDGSREETCEHGGEEKWNCLWMVQREAVCWGTEDYPVCRSRRGSEQDTTQKSLSGAGMRKSRASWSGSGMRAPYIQQTEWRSKLTKTIRFLPRAPRGSRICRWLPSLLFHTHSGSFLEFSTEGYQQGAGHS